MRQTYAGKTLIAERDFHRPDCPCWFAVSAPDPSCTCDLITRVADIEAESRKIDYDTLAQAIANTAYPEQSRLPSDFERNRAIEIVAEYERLES